ncbi:MAG: MBL fold metallo-hydrolase [Patescibacteria group bacterium]
MRITKFGHSCLLVEEGGARIMLDPGSYSTGQNDAKDVDAILITHEHQDHLSPDSLKAVLKNSPNAKVFANKGVGAVLQKEGIAFTIVEGGTKFEVKGVTVEAVGRDHAVIHPSMPAIRNTGYIIADRLLCPGDALTNPGRPVEILALPVVAPWVKSAEVIDYALAVKPRVCFPIHDGMLGPNHPFHRVPELALKPGGVAFEGMVVGEMREF